MSLAFVLHSHLPWLRKNGTFPAGEEWLFQAWSEAYLPLIEVLERLAADGLRDVLTIGITPVLADQMDDPYLLAEFHGWLGRRMVDLEHTVARYGGADGNQLRQVWGDHWRRQRHLLETFASRFREIGLTAPFRALAEAGVIELLGGPATHPYLPLMDDPSLIRGQISSGLASHAKIFGAGAPGVWTPECAYRPAGPVTNPLGGDSTSSLPGLEAFWEEAGVTHLVLDGPTLALGAGADERDWSSVGGAIEHPGGPLDVLDAPLRIGDSDVVAFGRNLAVSYAVWNPHGGYPADGSYRDFHRVDLEGGFKSWRVTALDRWDKAPYDAAAADARARAHADEFLALVERYLSVRGNDATIVAAYDTELFGHWWFEGPVWLEAVLRGGAASRDVGVTTLARRLQRGVDRRLHLPESSWGMGKHHRAWVNEHTRWVWEAIRAAEARFATLPAGPSRDVAWRQLTLLQASDWPFLMSRDQSTQYAQERVRTHLARFQQACEGTDLAGLAAQDGSPGRVPALSVRSALGSP